MLILGLYVYPRFEKRLELLQGTLDPLILRTLIFGPQHGQGIARTIQQTSEEELLVEHEVKLMDFTKWLDKTGGSPREVTDRRKVRSILGMPVPR